MYSQLNISSIIETIQKIDNLEKIFENMDSCLLVIIDLLKGIMPFQS